MQDLLAIAIFTGTHGLANGLDAVLDAAIESSVLCKLSSSVLCKLSSSVLCKLSEPTKVKLKLNEVKLELHNWN